MQSQLPRDPLPGHCVLPRAHPGRFLKIMLKPIHMVMRHHLRNRGTGGLVKHLWRYLAFKMWLGMLKPRRIDDLFENGHPDEDKYSFVYDVDDEMGASCFYDASGGF